MIRLAIPSIEEEDLIAVRDALASGFLVQGKRTAELEAALASYIGVEHAVAVSNCTAALHLSLLALGVGAGDEVLVTAYSWPATANVIELCGAKPIFVDINRRTFNIDPNHLEQLLQSRSSSKVKAILPVHAFGQLADMPQIVEIADRFGVPVIEDAACALGATLDERQAGTWGVLGCFSFHPRKAITTGEGGLITTNDPKLARQLRILRNHGQDPEAASPDFVNVGFNYRMTEFQAALGSSQLKKLDRIISARRRLASNYNLSLENTSIMPPLVDERCKHVYQSYVVTLPKGSAPFRTELIRDLFKEGVETTLGTWHLPMTTFFRKRYGFQEGDFPNADRAFAETLSLPLYESLSEKDQHFVVTKLVASLQKYVTESAVTLH